MSLVRTPQLTQGARILIKGYPGYETQYAKVIHVDGEFITAIPEGRQDSIELAEEECFVCVRNADYRMDVDPRPPKNQKIMAAAILVGGKLWTGRRHADLIKLAVRDRCGEAPIKQHHQGFVDQRNTFYHRPESARIAFEAGQLNTDECPEKILSEDIW